MNTFRPTVITEEAHFSYSWITLSLKNNVNYTIILFNQNFIDEIYSNKKISLCINWNYTLIVLAYEILKSEWVGLTLD